MAKPVLGQRSTSEKHKSSRSSKLEPAIWSHDTGQRMPCFDRCQLTIAWMFNIKDRSCKPSVRRRVRTIEAGFCFLVNTEKLNLTRIVLKRLQTPRKQKLYTQQEKVSRFYYFLPLFWTIPYDRFIPIQTLVITLLRNVTLTVPRELGLPLQ